MENSLEYQIKKNLEKFLESSKNKEIYIVSHFDTDGVTSAAIMVQTLKKLDKKFSLKIIKSLEENFIKSLPQNKLILFLDLASGSLNYLNETTIDDIFIIDHHEINQSIPEKINIINPELNGKEKISASGLTYLFCKELLPQAKEHAKLAVLGMIGDLLEKEVDKLNHGILNDGEIVKKRGLLIYPATRPVNRTLEYSSNPYIPEVTGEIKGVLELLRECGISPKNGGYPSMIDLTEEETQRLITGILLRIPSVKEKEIIGDIFLIKLFNKLEDAREISAMINACSRLGEPGIAVKLCMEIPKCKKQAESIHTKYRQHIISALNIVKEIEHIKGKNFVIINAQEKIKDTIIGTTASILSNSQVYEKGTIIITMAHDHERKNQIKISARVAGRSGRNVREVLTQIINQIGGEVGGHKFAAGCIIQKEKEKEFMELIKKSLEVERIKID